MHWESFYVDPKNIDGNELVLTGDEVHHLSRVMRKKKGDLIWAVDGQGSAYQAEILYIAKNDVRARIKQTRRRLAEPVAEITLAQGVLKGDRFDWLVEKATEIGVRRIIPMTSDYTEIEISAQKLGRWKRLALAAMKQCGRSILTEISQPESFHEVIRLGANCQHRYFAHSSHSRSPLKIESSTGAIKTPKALLIVGPEGGFSESEVEAATEHGFHTASLGPRRLRAETAGLVLSTIVLSQLGELE